MHDDRLSRPLSDPFGPRLAHAWMRDATLMVIDVDQLSPPRPEDRLSTIAAHASPQHTFDSLRSTASQPASNAPQQASRLAAASPKGYIATAKREKDGYH